MCFVGAEDRLFQPGWTPPARFVALFIGKLIPLQGVETILAAARLAPEVDFRIVGSGQLDKLLVPRPPNVEHVPWLDYELLPGAIRSAGCALGIFGTGAKARRVIPNKAFQALACGAPLITADTQAARELLTRRDERAARSAWRSRGARRRGPAARRRCRARSPNRRGRTRTYERQAGEPVLGERWRELIERLL